jgi:hypothetical protein
MGIAFDPKDIAETLKKSNEIVERNKDHETIRECKRFKKTSIPK